MNDRRISIFKALMLLFNIIAVSFIVAFIIIITQKICQFNMARTFINGVVTIPKNPMFTLWITVILMSIFVITFLAREYFCVHKTGVIYGTLIIDFLISILLMYVLNFNYNGIVFWVFANVIYYVKEKGKYLFVVLAIITYVGTDYQLLSIRYHLFSVKDYMLYFNASKQQYYLGIFNVLISVNVILFIVFCVFVIQQQRGIIDEVNFLYKKLTDTNEELQYANEELKQYADLKEKMGQTKERNRLAREIHDTLGHTLTGISAGLDACIAIIDVAPEQTKNQLNTLSKVTRDGISEIRRSVNELRPDALERLNLESAITKMIMDFKSVTNAKIDFICEVHQLKFDEDEENIIFRIIQESITNAIRHGKASEVNVVMEKRNGYIHLLIQDNGVGCNQIKPGFGTKHMLERVHMLNGEITFSGEVGFKVDAKIPIRWGETYD